jgi:large subunit ribosomal protein L10
VDRSEKQQLITSLHKTLKTAQLVVITRQSGLTVAEVTNLRRQMRQAGASYKVTKNRLARLALEGTEFEGLKSMFTGPTAIAYSADPIAAAKVAVTYANSNEKLKIVGGAMGGQVLDPTGIKALATLPSLDELRGKIVGVLAAPAAKIAAVLQAPGSKLARVLNAYASKGDAA